MKNPLRDLPMLLKRTYRGWQADHASRLAASLAYYTIFSLAPMLVIVMAVAGFLWQREAAEAQLMVQIRSLVGAQGAEFIAGLLSNTGSPGKGLIATTIGLLTLLLGALGVFNELHHAINVIWGARPDKPENFIKSMKKILVDRFMSFGMVVGIGFLLLVSLVVSTAISAAQELLGDVFIIPEIFLQLLNLVVSIGVITVLFAMIYKYLPDIKIPWRFIWPGAFVTAILFSIGKSLLGLYLGSSAVASSFGAAGSLALLLIWIYYSAQILLFGAEFTQIYADVYAPPLPASAQPLPPPIPVYQPPTALIEAENRQTARFLLGLILGSFISGLIIALWGLRKQ